MDNHPIPQDVTGFQFRLIGSLTVKQFAYVAASAILAFIILQLPGIHVIIKLLLIPLVGGIGPALAFLPVEGRPLDQMTGHFLKALITPNQYLYHKTGGKLPLSTVELHKVKQLTEKEVAAKKAEKEKVEKKEEKLAQYLNQIHKEVVPLDTHEQAFMQAVLTGQPAPQSPVSQPVPQPTVQAAQAPMTAPTPVPLTTMPVEPTVVQTPSPEDQEKKIHEVEAVIKKEDELAKELTTAKEKAAHDAHSQQTPQTAALDQQLQQIMQQKALLEQELQKLQQNLMAAQQSVATQAQQQPAPVQNPTPQPEPIQKPAAPVADSGARKLPGDQASKAGIPTLPDIPNLLLGIVKDPRGNVLPGVLVEVKDADDNPVRAFKTNGLGQFAAATALQNGTYTILFEDPKGQHKFDIVELTVKGDVIPPIEVVSHDAREELRQALFS